MVHRFTAPAALAVLLAAQTAWAAPFLGAAGYAAMQGTPAAIRAAGFAQIEARLEASVASQDAVYAQMNAGLQDSFSGLSRLDDKLSSSLASIDRIEDGLKKGGLFVQQSTSAARPAVPRPAAYAQLDSRLQGGLANVEADLKRDKWTMLIGDSVLAQEFLALSKVLFAPTCGGALFHQELMAEAQGPGQFFLNAPIEYLTVCKRGANGTRQCEMTHEECLHLTPPEPCPDQRSDPFCGHVNHRLCSQQEYQSLVQRATGPDVEFAVSYHWAPGPGLARRDPDIGALDPRDPGASAGADVALLGQRLAQAQPGAILMNNCLHTWPYSWSLPQGPWQERLALFQRALQENLRSLSAAGYKGRFSFMGCLPLACTDKFVWKGWGNCQAQNSELQAVNVGVKRLFEGLGLGSSFVDSWRVAKANQTAAIDGIHPCWTRPCEWQPKAPQGVDTSTFLGSFWLDTDPSACLAVTSQAWAALGHSRLPAADRIASTPLPNIADLRPDLFTAQAAPPPAAQPGQAPIRTPVARASFF